MTDSVDLVVLPRLSNSQYFDYVWDLLVRSSDEGRSVRVLDLSEVETGAQDAIPRLSWARNPMRPALQGFRASAEELGVRWEVARNRPTLPSDIDHSVSTLHWIAELEQWPFFGGSLGRSIYSLIVTDIARGFSMPEGRLRRVVRKLASDYWSAYDYVTKSLSDSGSVQRVVVFNGRAPIQAGGAQAGHDAGRVVLHLEHGGTAGERYRLEEWVSQNRLLEQRDLMELRGELTEEEIRTAEKWLRNQEHDFGVNRFAQSFALEGDEGQPRGATDVPHKPVACIFTSSIDEFAGYDDEAWPPSPWVSQEQAIVSFADELSQRGYSVVIRVHPNLCNKNWEELRRVASSLKVAKATVVGPASSTSSYSLVRESDICLVWASTIGLEASAVGKPVYVLYHALYDLMADVRLVNGRGSLPLDLVWNVDRQRAIDYLALALQRGESLVHVPTEGVRDELALGASKLDRKKRHQRMRWTPILVFTEPSHSLKILRRLLGWRRGSAVWTWMFWTRSGIAK